MRAIAAVFEELCAPLTVTKVEIDSPGPGEALVKIVATGVCHTDALARDGDMPFPAPGVLGHEGAGIVERSGDFALDCAGNVTVLRQAADSVGMRGTVALIGGAPAGASFSLDHLSTLWGKRVIGTLGGEGRSVSLIGALIALNRQGRFPYDRLIQAFPLDQVSEALEASHSGEVIRPVLRLPD